MRARWHIQSDDVELLHAGIDDPDAFGVFYDRTERQILAFFVRATGRPTSPPI
jgi:hypothetical protein